MKLKRILPALQTKSLNLYTAPDKVQWVGSGGAAYPLYDLPELDGDTLLAVLDVPADKRDQYHVECSRTPSLFNFHEDDDTAQAVTLTAVERIGGEDGLLGIAEGRKLLLYDPRYLRPLGTDLQLEERVATNGCHYLAVKEGLMLQAIILPMSLSSERRHSLSSELSRFSRAILQP